MIARRAFEALPDGAYRVRLDRHERAALRLVCAELRAALRTGGDATARLYPAAYPDDPAASAEFDRLVRNGLVSERLNALDKLEATADASRLDESDVTAWCGVLNDARLVLGERIGVTEELYETGISPDDPRAEELAFYAWLTWLQGELVEALSSRL